MLQRPVNVNMNIGSIDSRRGSLMQGLGGGDMFSRPLTTGGQPQLPPKMQLGNTGHDGMPYDTPLKSTDIASDGGKSPSRKVSPMFKSTTKDPEKIPVDSKNTRRKKKWKKPKDKPNRPLSAYNLFFAKERTEMLGDDVPTPEQEALKKRIHCKTHGKIPFAVMARHIGAKWKTLDPETKRPFEEKAATLKEKYLVELSAWKETQKDKAEAKAAVQAASHQKNLDAIASATMNHPQGLPSSSASSSMTPHSNDPDAAAAMAMSRAFMAKRMSMNSMPNPMGMPPDSSMRFFMENGMAGMNGMNGINGMNGFNVMNSMDNHARGMSQMHLHHQAMQDHSNDQTGLFGFSASGQTEQGQESREQRQQQSSPMLDDGQRSGSGSPNHQQHQNRRQQYEQHPNFAAEASANALMMQFNDAYPVSRGSSCSSKSSNRRRSSNVGDKEREPTPREHQHAVMLAERERLQQFANMRRLQQRAFMTGGFMNLNGMQM
jgi:HMG (high mobility group) box